MKFFMLEVLVELVTWLIIILEPVFRFYGSLRKRRAAIQSLIWKRMRQRLEEIQAEKEKKSPQE